MGIELKAVNQKYGGLKVLHDINLAIAEGEMIALVGPSGCGKTTLLKTIAGLLPLSQGQIWLKGKDISHLPAQDRNAVMVFQNYALFPHMTVAENISYGLKIRRVDKAQRQARVQEIIAKTELLG
ncbi:MAG: ABC transporter ATP-binding protein, partial [Syntrophomonadaceae bacterium]|nr:ABC transporter ATP-binding protein [Syntrophomonadaceae bacterium]